MSKSIIKPKNSGFEQEIDFQWGEISFPDWSDPPTFDAKKPKSEKRAANKLINDRKQYVRFMDTMYNRVNSAEDLIGKLPLENQQIRIVTQKSFNAFALLLLIVQNFKIEEMFLAIYRIDKHSVEGIKNLILDGQIKNTTIILSSFFRGAKRVERWHLDLADFAKQSKNVRLIYCWNHAKVLAVKTICGNYFVIEGSGNLSDNARIEQYLFENNKETFQFHKQWMEEVYSFSAEKDVSEI